ncbi:MAG: tRNA (adenosine(37)-N6)-threonylcarbamoyltransferase complex dimerization subunit type 1 TsaB [Gammaproteobacteria bacterium]|nr:tRNA (adenosine(37)-N6)-threonylcarbamoyltransferase complex dimerization subunit type 1 TsaB [Gammaproteobacteria bacterium]
MNSITAPLILAIETATSACSVALLADGTRHQQSQIGNNIHSRVLLTMVQAVLQEAQVGAHEIDAVAVGQGPGSFTGIRIGVGVAQGLAFGAGCPIIGISSLDALARQSTVDGKVIAGIDARMGEVYWCEYLKSGRTVSRQTALQLSAPGAIRISGPDSFALVGNAWAEYQEEFDDKLLARGVHLQDIRWPGATALLDLAETKFALRDWVAAGDFVPEYLRDDVAKKPSVGN